MSAPERIKFNCISPQVRPQQQQQQQCASTEGKEDDDDDDDDGAQIELASLGCLWRDFVFARLVV